MKKDAVIGLILTFLSFVGLYAFFLHSPFVKDKQAIAREVSIANLRINYWFLPIETRDSWMASLGVSYRDIQFDLVNPPKSELSEGAIAIQKNPVLKVLLGY